MISPLEIIPLVIAFVSMIFVYFSGGSFGQVPQTRILFSGLLILTIGFACSLGYGLSAGAWKNLVPSLPYALDIFGNIDMICFAGYAILLAWWSYRVFVQDDEAVRR